MLINVSDWSINVLLIKRSGNYVY